MMENVLTKLEHEITADILLNRPENEIVDNTVLVHNYLNSKDLNRQFLCGLENRRLDVKLFYQGEQQAQNWINLCHSEEYCHYRNFLKFLKSIVLQLDEIIQGDINLISLGIGDGEKEKVILEQFLLNRQAGLFMVDASVDLIRSSLKNLAQLGVAKEAFVADIVQHNVIKDIGCYAKKSNRDRINLYTFMGSTIGNVSQSAIFNILRETMKPGDYILIEFHVRSSDENYDSLGMVKEYGGDINRGIYFTLLEKSGITEDDGDVSVEYMRHHTLPFIDVIEIYFSFYKSKIVRFFGEELYFAGGEKILMESSCVYTIESVIHLLESYGMKVVKTFQDNSNHYLTTLCQMN